MDPDTSSNNGDYLPSYETVTALAEHQELSSSVTALISAPPPSYYTTVQQPGSDNASEDRGSSPVQSVSPPPQYSRGRRYATREVFEADIKARQQKLIKLGGNHLIVSLILTVLWGLLCPLLLFCSITALVMSVRGRDQAKSKDIVEAKESFQYSICCNASSVVIFGFALVTLVIIIPIAILQQ